MAKDKGITVEKLLEHEAGRKRATKEEPCTSEDGTLNLSPEEGRHLILDVYDDWEPVQIISLGSVGRWSEGKSGIFQHKSGRHYMLDWQVGATEVQEERAFECTDPQPVEVHQVDVRKVEWRPVSDAGLPRSVTIDIRDVRTDGFPGEDERVFFWSSHALVKGYPLLCGPTDTRDHFQTPEGALEDPDSVWWESAEGLGLFMGCLFWVPADALEKAFRP